MDSSGRVLTCTSCGLVQRTSARRGAVRLLCARCKARVGQIKPNALQHTAAFSLAALFLYVPANVLPFMEWKQFGRSTEATIWSGVVALWESGMWGVATLVFLASIVVPLLKLLGLFFLVVTARSDRWRYDRAQLHRLLEAIGRWSMLDVFLLAILVALVKLGDIARVSPRPGIAYFAAVVVLTMLATASFDPALIWSKRERLE